MLDALRSTSSAVRPSLHELVRSLRQALQDEMQSRHRPHHNQPMSLALHDGRVQSRHGRHQRVIFRTPSLPLRGCLDDTQGELIVDGHPHPCMILGLTVDQVTLSLVAELHDDIPHARLTIDRLRLLQALDTRLATIQAHPQEYLTELALKCFTPSAVPQRIQDSLSLSQDPNLNPEQFEALLRAMTHDFLFLWGPPGTGKTKVIGAATRLGLERGDRVLICSNTNTAVDQALEAVLDHLPDSSKEGIVRYGLAADDASPLLAPVTLETRVAGPKQELEASLVRIQSQLGPLTTEISRLEHLLALHDDLIAIEVRYAAASHAELTLQRRLTEARDRCAAAEEVFTTLDTERSHHQTVSCWRRLLLRPLHRIDTDRLHASLALDRHRAILKDLTVHARSFATTAQDLLCSRRQLQQSLAKQMEGRSLHELRSLYTTAQDAYRALHLALTACQRDLARLDAQIIRSARVIATTLTRTYTASLMERERFDVVIIDEGSMATPPALFAALCLARRQVLIVGDFLQLPPIAESCTDHAKHWLATDIYRLAGINNDQDPRVAALSTQYRMHPDIAALAARLYRRAGLAYRTDSHIRSIRQPLVALAPLPGKAFAFIDTSDGQPWVEKDHKGSPRNHYHAALAVRLAQQTLDAAHDSLPSVSLIAPYRNQVRLLQDLVQKANLTDRIRVGTIHNFQGQQSDVVIFDTTVTGDLTRTMLGRCDQDQSPCKLMNVACTRGKSKLLIIGHRPSIATLAHTPDSLLWDALQLAVDQDVVLSSRQVLYSAHSTNPTTTVVDQPSILPTQPISTPLPQTMRPPARQPRLYMIR